MSRPRSRGWWIAAILPISVAGFLSADPPTIVESPPISDLIRQLGHEEFAEREAASKAREATGERALATLRIAATTNNNPEIRQRAGRIIRTVIWSVRKSKSTAQELVPLVAGEFQMGSPRFETNRKADETQNRVGITRTFLLGVYEVTQA